jgi:hypothetical protein
MIVEFPQVYLANSGWIRPDPDCAVWTRGVERVEVAWADQRRQWIARLNVNNQTYTAIYSNHSETDALQNLVSSDAWRWNEEDGFGARCCPPRRKW